MKTRRKIPKQIAHFQLSATHCAAIAIAGMSSDEQYASQQSSGLNSVTNPKEVLSVNFFGKT